MHPFKEILNEYIKIVNETLEGLMDIEENAVSRKLVESMKYTLFSGGKRVRPYLTIEVANIVDGNMDVAKMIGGAIELIHTYSLVHDDLPAMDDDDYRRGQLTNHRVYGNDMAILAGDGLLTFAFNILSQVNLPPAKVIKIIKLISAAAGYNGMVGGQALDILNDKENISINKLKKIHSAKTGALFECSILAGACCGNPSNAEIEALSNYARYLGITFQIVDDILDVTGDEKKLGKNTGRDSELNKATYTSLLGVKEAKKRAREYAEDAINSLDIFAERAKNLHKLIDYILYRQS